MDVVSAFRSTDCHIGRPREVISKAKCARQAIARRDEIPFVWGRGVFVMSGRMVGVVVSVMWWSAVFGPAALAGDAGAGRSVFQSSCGICHSVAAGKNGVGPTLSGIVGRKTGSVAGYNYSPANEAANLTWDQATLDTYLQAPRATIPGTKMTFGGVKDATKRGDLIAYLATLK
jgi:cytochrome c